mmetsp:Transcript_16105/g.22925  ORF Transcript_16105/g.22925 Transcript_16105/m.22925 type:complete len:377 (+) Transcript_16105:120-1250(+)
MEIQMNFHNFLAMLVCATSLISSISAFGPMSVEIKYPTNISFCSSVPIEANFYFETRQTRVRSFPICAFATIYGWDDEESETAYYAEKNVLEEHPNYDYVYRENVSRVQNENLAIALSENPERQALLARLASAFSPEGLSLPIENLTHVKVVAVDSKHIEISAIVCEDEQCVTILVPISFAKECSLGDNCNNIENCVLQNLFDLDGYAYSILNDKNTKKLGSHHQSIDISCEEWDTKQLASLYTKQRIEYPPWWVLPERDTELEDQCETIKRLLNGENFKLELLALTKMGMSCSKEFNSFTSVDGATVSAIGPAGFCFKVMASKTCDIDGLSLEKEEIVSDVLELSVPFRHEPVTDADALKTAVLSAITTAMDRIG